MLLVEWVLCKMDVRSTAFDQGVGDTSDFAVDCDLTAVDGQVSSMFLPVP